MPVHKKLILASGAACLFVTTGAVLLSKTPSLGWNLSKTRFTLPNNWNITPVGNQVELPGDMPGNIIFSTDGKKAIVNTSGFHNHSLNLIDLATKKIDQSIDLKNSWIGLARTGNTILVSAGGITDGNENKNIFRFTYSNNSLTAITPFQLNKIEPKSRFVSGIVTKGERVYVLNIQSDQVLLMHKDGSTRRVVKVGYRPYAAALSPNGQTLAVTEWGNKSVVLLDANNLAFKARFDVGPHPSAIAWTRDDRILVTESSSNSIAVIEGSQLSRVTVAIEPQYLVGSMPQAIALSKDELKAFVALGGENAIAVLDLKPKRPKVIGHIPTIRFPSAIAVTPDNKSLIIATAKGFYGPNGGSATRPKGSTQPLTERNIYVGDQLAGNINILKIPTDSQLKTLTAMAIANRPVGEKAVPLSTNQKAKALANMKKIKHVIYVIRENRTYDQVLGDIAKGNGDPSLTLFGKKFTPNSHALANEFCLYDNLFTDGETSQAGHQWTNSAYASDYTEKAWIMSYSGRPQVNSDARMTASPEYLWTLARKNGHWARVYGEYVDVQEDHNSLNAKELKDDPEAYGYSEEWERIFARGGRDTEKIESFFKELTQFEKTGKMPALMVMALPDDHTHGFDPGSYSPTAMIGNNDLALGQLVDRISRSKFWDSTAIFVIQDDAQGGPDHVDSHRTVGHVISAYGRKGTVDSTHYTTASMLRTMELILGLPPMTTFDGNATPMIAAFSKDFSAKPFSAITPNFDINEINPSKTELALRSAKLDFSEVDKADFGELNRILWQGYRPGIPYPSHLATDK
ncbi:MAG: alkaline phosphatase family protein [Fimbriimonadaceae bacterium]